MFKLDEVMVNEQFGRRLDVMPSNIASRSVDFPVIGQLTLLRLPGLKLLRLLGCEEAEIGLKIIFTDQLLRRGNEDAIQLVVRQLVDSMVGGIIEQHHSVGRSLIVGPLMFEYAEGLIEVGEKSMFGTEAVVITFIEWNSLI